MYYSSVLQEIHSTLPGAMRGSQGRVQAERATGLGSHALMGGVLCGSQAKANWSIQTQMSGVLVSSTGILSKGHTRGRPWEVGETVDHKSYWGSHTRNAFSYDSEAAI